MCVGGVPLEAAGLYLAATMPISMNRSTTIKAGSKDMVRGPSSIAHSPVLLLGSLVVLRATEPRSEQTFLRRAPLAFVNYTFAIPPLSTCATESLHMSHDLFDLILSSHLLLELVVESHFLWVCNFVFFENCRRKDSQPHATVLSAYTSFLTAFLLHSCNHISWTLSNRERFNAFSAARITVVKTTWELFGKPHAFC